VNQQRETQVSLRNLPSFGDLVIALQFQAVRALQPNERLQGEAYVLVFVYRLLQQSERYRFVGQFVWIDPIRRKMARKQLADFRNPGNHTVLVPRFAERVFHPSADGVPFVLRDLSRDAAVSNDLDVPVDELKIDEYPGVFFRVPHAQEREHIERALPWCDASQDRQELEGVLHRKPDLAAMPLLRSAHRSFDSIERTLRKRAPHDPRMREHVTQSSA
jgi:hypothetical protein